MSDLISRKDAIDYFVTNIGVVDADGYAVDDYDERVKIWTERFSGIPSAEPEWIPVTEALPEDMDRLLATIVRSNGEKRVRSGHYYKGLFMMDNGDTWNETDKEILAWMPLVEPWEGE